MLRLYSLLQKRNSHLNIFICVKQVPDIRSDIVPNTDADYIETKHLHWIINTEDECAVEQALQIREQIPESTITALRIGSEKDSEALITAMAMGADESILVLAEEQQLDPYITAKALKAAIKHSGKKPDIILCGNQSFGEESCQVPQILAQMLDFPCVTRVTSFSFTSTGLDLASRIEGGLIESYKANFPIVIACSYGLNEPRYAPLPHIKRAYKKPMIKLKLNDIGISSTDRHLRYSNYRPAPIKKTGKFFDATNNSNIDNVVAEVIENLRADIKLF